MADLEKKFFVVGPVKIKIRKPGWPTWKDIVKGIILATAFYCAWEGCQSFRYEEPNDYHSENYQTP